MKLDMVQARQFSVLLNHFLDTPLEGGETPQMCAHELGLPIEDYDPLIHWPRLCTRRALSALRVVENEISATNWEDRRS